MMILPETNINKTVLGLTIRYINAGKKSGSYVQNWECTTDNLSNRIGNFMSTVETMFWILNSENFT